MAEQQKMEIRMTSEDLYLEEVFTDRRVGTIQRLTPVTASGDADPSRPLRFVGQAQIMTPAGALPLSFEIAANSLQEAVDGFGAAAEVAVEDTMKRIEEMRREAASSLIVPGASGGAPGGGMPGGGMPGGGIQMP
ncbi:MAG: hypothetical protein WBO47_00895 [Gammaproteobacteria bacterium]